MPGLPRARDAAAPRSGAASRPGAGGAAATRTDRDRTAHSWSGSRSRPSGIRPRLRPRCPVPSDRRARAVAGRRLRRGPRRRRPGRPGGSASGGGAARRVGASRRAAARSRAPRRGARRAGRCRAGRRRARRGAAFPTSRRTRAWALTTYAPARRHRCRGDPTSRPGSARRHLAARARPRPGHQGAGPVHRRDCAGRRAAATAALTTPPSRVRARCRGRTGARHSRRAIEGLDGWVAAVPVGGRRCCRRGSAWRSADRPRRPRRATTAAPRSRPRRPAAAAHARAAWSGWPPSRVARRRAAPRGGGARAYAARQGLGEAARRDKALRDRPRAAGPRRSASCSAPTRPSRPSARRRELGACERSRRRRRCARRRGLRPGAGAPDRRGTKPARPRGGERPQPGGPPSSAASGEAQADARNAGGG